MFSELAKSGPGEARDRNSMLRKMGKINEIESIPPRREPSRDPHGGNQAHMICLALRGALFLFQVLRK